MRFVTLVVSILCLARIQTFAHGEDLPGPHGGHIRMPGGFHTELVLEAKKIRVYLLDISFLNPQTKDSEVTARYIDQKAKAHRLECEPKNDFFSCQLPKEYSSTSGKFAIQGKRGEIYGQLAEYPLPLPGFKKPSKKSKLKVDHSQH